MGKIVFSLNYVNGIKGVSSATNLRGFCVGKMRSFAKTGIPRLIFMGFFHGVNFMGFFHEVIFMGFCDGNKVKISLFRIFFP